jgi:uncharacterized protein YaaQ
MREITGSSALLTLGYHACQYAAAAALFHDNSVLATTVSARGGGRKKRGSATFMCSTFASKRCRSVFTTISSSCGERKGEGLQFFKRI